MAKTNTKRKTRRATVFTEEKLKLFKKLYPSTSNTELAKKLGTTPGTINWKASVMGLRKSKSYMNNLFSAKRKTVKKSTSKKKTAKKKTAAKKKTTAKKKPTAKKKSTAKKTAAKKKTTAKKSPAKKKTTAKKKITAKKKPVAKKTSKKNSKK